MYLVHASTRGASQYCVYRSDSMNFQSVWRTARFSAIAQKVSGMVSVVAALNRNRNAWLQCIQPDCRRRRLATETVRYCTRSNQRLMSGPTKVHAIASREDEQSTWPATTMPMCHTNHAQCGLELAAHCL